MFVVLGLVVISIITKQSLRAIRSGIDDDKIKKELNTNEQKRKAGTIFEKIATTILCAILLLVFLLSLYINIAQNCFSEKIPTINVVRTSSMEKKNEKNTYLYANKLNDQIGTFDLILTYKKPPADELELYDIVVYEVNGTRIVHRIVDIEEPNETHPDEYWFRLQGDAIETADRFPVHYSQILGIYRGERVPFVGSFVLFMQSPAGWLCIILVIGALIATPILEKKIAKERQKRLAFINQTGGPKFVKVVDVYNAIDSNGRYFYTDESGVKIYSSYPIQVKRADGIIKPNDISRTTDVGDKK
jgi:hypothetical protein